MSSHKLAPETPGSTNGRDGSASVSLVTGALLESSAVLTRTAHERAADIVELADDIWAALSTGRKLLTFGNGGSAADAQHLAGELVGRFTVNRVPYPAIALSTDTSTLTGIANDFGYAEVFARQVSALYEPGDVVLGLSTSGRSESILRGLDVAVELDAVAWALTGQNGLQRGTARTIQVPSTITARIQEAHTTIIHALCSTLEVHMQASSLA